MNKQVPIHPQPTPGMDTGQPNECAAILAQALDEPGILRVSLEPGQQIVTFDYDPTRVNERTIGRLLHRMAPIIQQTAGECVSRPHRDMAQACAACATMIDDYVQRAHSIRRATATINGAQCDIAFDAPPVTDLAGDANAPQPGQTDRTRALFTQQRVESIFVVITFAAMLLALLADRAMGAPALAGALYALAYVTGGAFGLRAGLAALRERTIDIDLLMVLAAIGAAIVGAPFEGAMLLFLFSLSNVLQAYAVGRTRAAIQSLVKLRPTRALVRRGSRLEVMPIDRIVVGDRMIIRPGERIPLDGVVVEGESAVDQASITGESMPVTRRPGDRVFGGTINQSGGLEVRVARLAKDSTIARLIKLVEDAQSEKAHTQRVLDKAERYYAAGVLAFTAIMIVAPVLLFHEPIDTAFYRAMTLMVVASPCALIISTPATILSAIGNGARKGILFKGGVHLERAAGINVVAFDKTGTLTEGKPRVTDVLVTPPAEIDGLTWSGKEEDLLALAAAVEVKSEHPVARAIVHAANTRGVALDASASPVTGFVARPGLGVRARVNGLDIAVGSPRYFESFECMACNSAVREVERLQGEGKTSILVARVTGEGRAAQVLGVIAVADQLRPDAARVVSELRGMGVRTVMLTGDNKVVAQAIAEEAGVDEFHAGLLPEDKVWLIQQMAQNQSVAMVGDGINDAPALATATVGIAMGAAGTDVALETADVVLMADDLTNIPYVISLSRAAQRTVKHNLIFAGAVIVIMLLAALGVQVPLPLGVVAHEGSTVLVSLNGLRLLAWRSRT